MSQRAVEGVFRSLFLLTDIRSLLRATAPAHRFDDSQKELARELLASLKTEVAALEEELGK